MAAVAAPQPTCAYCGGDARLITGAELYPHREDLASKSFWRCVPCRAWVGCHPGTIVPLGRLANAALRKAKAAAHAAFDPMWRGKMERDGVSKKKARSAGYAWLAEQLGLTADECHIGMFDEATCARVVEVCTNIRRAA